MKKSKISPRQEKYEFLLGSWFELTDDFSAKSDKLNIEEIKPLLLETMKYIADEDSGGCSINRKNTALLCALSRFLGIISVLDDYDTDEEYKKYETEMWSDAKGVLHYRDTTYKINGIYEWELNALKEILEDYLGRINDPRIFVPIEKRQAEEIKKIENFIKEFDDLSFYNYSVIRENEIWDRYGDEDIENNWPPDLLEVEKRFLEHKPSRI